MFFTQWDTQIWHCYIYAAQGLKMGGLGSGPSLKIGGFQSSHSWEKRDFGAKKKRNVYILKMRGFSIWPGRKSRTKNCIFFKKGSFGVAHVEKVVYRSVQGRKMGGFRVAYACTVLIWEYPPPCTPLVSLSFLYGLWHCQGFYWKYVLS